MPSLKQHQRHNIILERLKNGETLSISELAKEWQTTTKTVQRDFDKLKEGNYGIIRAYDGKKYTLSTQYNTSKDANSTISMLDSLSKDIGGEFYTKAQVSLRRLQKYIQSPFYTRIDVEDISEKMDLIEALEKAISDKYTVTFKYKRWHVPDQIKTYKDVHPYKIVIFDGFWYLLCKYKEHFIKFYLKEITDLNISDKQFSQDHSLLERMEKAVNIWFNPKEKPFEVILLLQQNAAIYFIRKPIKGQYLKKNSDGTYELTISITDKRELFEILKKWLPQIKVIEPYHLQEEFEIMLKSYINC
ncbi:helix-turn-helix transcriptional regulator [Sulfurovum mangrovi]|uniref:helix-turn-helix transcriptional regulator n=1 Tax=Sulfurovum mangrovi TaxID=2893889 RepID=UPI001E2E97BF|nr:WYL domain-containing protein [Sulfurovum mangrovi]UFH58487.1 WYL domain-containing protein [Sulfurovum mangrovi]